MKQLGCFLFMLACLLSVTSYAGSTKELNYKLIASSETKMWQGYYEKDQQKVLSSLEVYFQEMFNLKNVKTAQQIANLFAVAYMKFGNTPIASPQEEYDHSVFPSLRDAYQVLKLTIGASWDPELAAKADLDWMIARRHQETLEPEMIAKKMTNLFHILYGDNDKNHFTRAAYLRAVAARYRDQCQVFWDGVDQDDWSVVDALLEKSYLELSKGL